MSRVRRVKPSTVGGRKRQAELGQIISSSRTSKEERAAALEELNLLAPIVGTSLSDNGTPSHNEDSFPSVHNPTPVRTGAQDLESLWGGTQETVPSLPNFALRSAHELDRTRARLWPLLSTRTITPETTAFAIEAATFTLNLFDKKFSDLTPEQQLGMTRFQLDAWAGTTPAPETIAVLTEVYDTANLK
jgi:hypothetical protein